MLNQPSPEEIACLRECLLPWLWEGMGALWLQAVGLSSMAGRSPDPWHSVSLPCLMISLAYLLGTDSCLPSTGRDVCSQCAREVHGGKPEREDPADRVLMEAGPSGQVCMGG